MVLIIGGLVVFTSVTVVARWVVAVGLMVDAEDTSCGLVEAV